MSNEFQRVEIDAHYRVYSRKTQPRVYPLWRNRGAQVHPLAQPDLLAMLRQAMREQIMSTTSDAQEVMLPGQTPAESPPPEPTDTSPEQQATHPLTWQVIV